MIAIGNDDLLVAGSADEQERGQGFASEDFLSVVLHMRIADTQQRLT